MLDWYSIDLELGGRTVLRQVDFRLRSGERVGILGPSGAGKSSLLRLAAGILKVQRGNQQSSFRHAVLAFQEPRLLPWCRVAENLEIPLRAAGRDPATARCVAAEWLERVGLSEYARSWPNQLSGGMAQRVALARALAVEPDLLLLDEPFSALDPALRKTLIDICRDWLEQSAAALLCVSHHPGELVGLVERFVLLNAGGLQTFDAADRAPEVLAEALHQTLMTLETSLP